MIVVERQDTFVMIEQHLHAKLSGVFASHWRDEVFLGFARRADVVLAITEHDRAWIDLDAHPLWNDVNREPFSFIDTPYTIKLLHYREGVDSLEKQNEYAALLCSMHYASFFEQSVNPKERAYRQFELDRQKRIRSKLPLYGTDDELSFQLGLLKFLDRLSLYVCLNEPGAAKDDEFPLYRNGFENSEKLGFSGGERVVAQWLDERRIGLSAFPFDFEFFSSVPLKVVTKDQASRVGIAKAYQSVEYEHRTVQLVSLV